MTLSYDTHEIAKLLGIHRNTVRTWFKAGLVRIDDRRPFLVLGSALKEFITERQRKRRRKCAPGEFYCFKCRAPRTPWGSTADATMHTENVIRLTALCCACETEMHRTVRRSDIPKFTAHIEIRLMAPERLEDCSNASPNNDSHGGQPNGKT